MNINFKITLENWNIVEKVGLPEDGEAVFVIFESDGDYDIFCGWYNKDNNEFRTEFCGIGASLQDNDAIAWLSMYNTEITKYEHNIDKN